MKCRTNLVTRLFGTIRASPPSEFLTAQTKKDGSMRIGRKTIPGLSNTPSQIAWRAKYAGCVTTWNELNDEEKAAYQEDADKKKITAFNQFMSSCLLAPSEKLYERYITYPDTAASCYDYWWYAQTFTVGNTGDNEAHVIAHVELMLYKGDITGDALIKIRAVDGAGKPTGPDLSTGVTDVGTLPTWPNHAWRSIDMSAYTLQASTKYAVIVAFPTGDASHVLWVGHEGTSPTYTGGQFYHSFDSGVGWWIYYNWDMWFKIFGAP